MQISARMRLFEAYKSDPFPFPEDNINPADKDSADYALKFLKAIYSQWCKGATPIHSGNHKSLQELRLYGEGKQSDEKYLNVLAGKKKKDGKRTGYMNIDRTIFTLLPKFKSVVLGMFQDVDYTVKARGLDKQTVKEKEDAYLDAKFYMEEGKYINAFSDQAGIPSGQPEFVPKSKEELDLWKEMGGFTAAAEMAWTKMIKATEQLSNMDHLKDEVLNDFFDIGYAATATEVADIDGKPRVRYKYLDPLKTVCQYSKSHGHENSDYSGYFDEVTVGHLYKKLRKAGHDVGFDEMSDLAKRYSGWSGNDVWSDTYNRVIEEGEVFPFADFKVLVFVGYYRTFNTEKRLWVTNDYGNRVMKPVDDYAKDVNTAKKKTVHYNVEEIYQGTWVVNTDYVYDYGPMRDAIRENNSRTVMPIKLYKLRGRSIVSLCTPMVDAIAIDWYKFQDAKAKSPMPGLAIDVKSLQNMTLGSKKVEEMELIKIRTQNGILFYSSLNHRGKFNNFTGRPIENIEGGLGRFLDEFIKTFQFQTELMREVTGISRLADASSPDPDAPVKTSELAIAGTNNALKPFFSGWLNLKERLSKDAVNRIRTLVKYDKTAYEGYYNVVGRNSMEVVEIGIDTANAEIGIDCKPTPSGEEKQQIYMLLQKASTPGKNGTPGITIAEEMMVLDEMNRGNLDLARYVLARSIEQRKKDEQKHAMQITQMQQQGELQKIQMKEQSDIKVHQAKAQIDVQKAAQIAQIDLEKETQLVKLDQRHEHTIVDKEIQSKEKIAGDKPAQVMTA